jgi:hypothetical protein
MPTNFQFPIAPLSVLSLVGTVGSTLVSIAAAGVLALRRSRWTRYAVAAAAVLPLGYGAALAGLSALSADVTVPLGGEKYFCDVDCHTAYAVTGVETASDLGAAHARGRFLIVALRTRFDAGTIGPRRGNAPLFPNPKVVEVVDSAGRHFPLDANLQQDLAKARGPQTSLEQPLRPGESFVTALAFDLPSGSERPRLLVTEADGFARLLLGHETAPGHGKTYFALQ